MPYYSFTHSSGVIRLAVLGTCVAVALVQAQPASAPRSQPAVQSTTLPATTAPATVSLPARQTAVPVTRADLADAYLKLEQSLRDHPPGEAEIARVNREFDDATLAFFSMQFGSAMQQIHTLTQSLRPARGTPGIEALAASLKARIEPPIGLAGATKAVRIDLGAFYPTDTSAIEHPALTLRLRTAGGDVLCTEHIVLERSPQTVLQHEVRLTPNAALAAGAYVVDLLDAHGEAYTLRRWYVVPRELATVRAEFEQQLRAIPTDTPEQQQAVAICRARAALLSDEPSEISSAEFLLDPIDHAAAVAAEITRLQQGQNPYRAHPGELWRVVSAGGRDLPVRTYAPRIVVEQPDRKLPLIISFHGAGGDEQMFQYGYGAGRIRGLAERHGVLIATPETGGFLRSPEAFDRLLESLERDYAIDPNRIYVLGHSLGAAVAGQLARTRADRIAAAAAIAGGMGTPTAEPLAPTLVIAAELDRITGGPDRVRQAVVAAREKGLPIEFRLQPNYGHTLIVGHVLPEVFDWLLARRSNVPTSAPASAPN